MKFYTDWVAGNNIEYLPNMEASIFWLGVVELYISWRDGQQKWRWAIYGAESGYSETLKQGKITVETKLKEIGYRYADERIRKAMVMI